MPGDEAKEGVQCHPAVVLVHVFGSDAEDLRTCIDFPIRVDSDTHQ